MRFWASFAWIVICGFCLTANADMITYNDGGTHTLSTTTSDFFTVLDGPGSQPTTLEITTGANLTGEVSAFEHSVVRVTGGTKTSTNLNLLNNAAGELSGGFVQTSQTFNSATLSVTGGSLDQLSARDESVVDIHKTIFTNLNPYSGVFVMQDALVSIYGSSFVLTDTVDDIFPETWDKFQLTGLFQDGTAFSTKIWRLKSAPGTLSLMEVPEPTSIVMGLMGAAALGVMVIRKRRTRG